MSEITTLSTNTQTLTFCVALVVGDDELPRTCGQPVRVVLEKAIVGDDYGSWPAYSVSTGCGHTLEQMAIGAAHQEFI